MTSADLIAGALDLHVLRGLSFYDALIVQAASVSGCQRVLTEDMRHGAILGGGCVSRTPSQACKPGVGMWFSP